MTNVTIKMSRRSAEAIYNLLHDQNCVDDWWNEIAAFKTVLGYADSGLTWHKNEEVKAFLLSAVDDSDPAKRIEQWLEDGGHLPDLARVFRIEYNNPKMKRLVDVLKRALHGNTVAREGNDRCACGCKYWEFDRCIDCQSHVSEIKETGS